MFILDDGEEETEERITTREASRSMSHVKTRLGNTSAPHHQFVAPKVRAKFSKLPPLTDSLILKLIDYHRMRDVLPHMTSPLRMRGGAKEKRMKIKKTKSSSSSSKKQVTKDGVAQSSQSSSQSQNYSYVSNDFEIAGAQQNGGPTQAVNVVQPAFVNPNDHGPTTMTVMLDGDSMNASHRVQSSQQASRLERSMAGMQNEFQHMGMPGVIIRTASPAPGMRVSSPAPMYINPPQGQERSSSRLAMQVTDVRPLQGIEATVAMGQVQGQRQSSSATNN